MQLVPLEPIITRRQTHMISSQHDAPTNPHGTPAQQPEADTAEIPVATYLPGIMSAEHLWNQDRLWASSLEFALQPLGQTTPAALERRIQDVQQPWRTQSCTEKFRRQDLRQVLHCVDGRTDGDGWIALITLADRRLLLLDVNWTSHLNLIKRTAAANLLVGHSVSDLVQWGMTEDQRRRMYTSTRLEIAHQQVQLHLQRWADGLMRPPPRHFS